MSLNQLLACSQCPSPQTFNPAQPLWMCACGHLRCSTHQTSPCCLPSPDILGDALADPLVKETCGYLLFLQGLGQAYVDFVYEKLAGLIIGRVEELYANYRLCSTCRRVLDAETGLCTYCAEEEEKALSRSAPVHRSSVNMFLSLDTLSMDPAQRLEPWQCPKCWAIVPAVKMTCICKYVNLKRVEVVLNCEESIKPKVVTTIAPLVSSQQYWICTNCRYEYNMTEKCLKCQQTRRTRPAVLPAGWTCVHCNTSNSQSLSNCSHCNRANAFASLISWTCPKCMRSIPTAAAVCVKCNLKQVDLWTCSCKVGNSPKEKKCRSCKKEREWGCSRCTLVNPWSKSKCYACEMPRNGAR